MKKIIHILIFFFIFTILAWPSILKNFSGTYFSVNSTGKDWCGKSIILKKIRFNKYKITWTLIDGDTTEVELKGRIKGNMLDFRREAYGYTYTFSNDNRKLTVTLKTPKEKRDCFFIKKD